MVQKVQSFELEVCGTWFRGDVVPGAKSTGCMGFEGSGAQDMGFIVIHYPTSICIKMLTVPLSMICSSFFYFVAV